MSKNKLFTIINIIYIVITAGVNIYGYFNLPEVIATQFNFSGGDVNHMPSAVYLIGSFLLVTILAIMSLNQTQEKKIKYFLINTIVLIANITIIVIQL